MEIIPVLSRLNGFEARLQNPSFISKILHNFSGGIQNISQISSFWTLGALLIAFLATFTKFKLFLLRLHKISRKLIFPSSQSSSSQPFISSQSDVDDEDDETCSSSGSSVSSLSDFDSEEEYPEDYDEQDDFRVAGSSNYEEERGHSFTWSDFANRGKNVVKSWPEGLNLGLGLDNSSCSLVSMWDNNGKNSNNSSNFRSSSSFFGQSMLSPAVIVSAGLIKNSKNVALKVWDTRVGRHIPEIIAEWQPCWKRVLSNGCLDSNSTDVVRDLRNVRAPVMDHHSITQWIDFDDSDMVNGRDTGNYLAGTNDSVVSRCLSAYFTL